jgi:hypothetical protein
MMALLALAGLTAGRAPAQVAQPDYIRIQYRSTAGRDRGRVPVNGENYRVDRALRICGRDEARRWRVIGRIERYLDGDSRWVSMGGALRRSVLNEEIGP